jgi:hypothetical protein
MTLIREGRGLSPPGRFSLAGRSQTTEARRARRHHEIVAGGLRVGFNPGELVDFLLGWTTLDIYNDDLGTRKVE